MESTLNAEQVLFMFENKMSVEAIGRKLGITLAQVRNCIQNARRQRELGVERFALQIADKVGEGCVEVLRVESTK